MSHNLLPAAQLLYDLGVTKITSEGDESVTTSHTLTKPDKPTRDPPSHPHPTPTDSPSTMGSPSPLHIPAYAAAAAVWRFHPPERCTHADIDALEVSDNPFLFSFKETIGIDTNVPCAGLVLIDDMARLCPLLCDIQRGCPEYCVKFWRSRLCKAHLLRIDVAEVDTAGSTAALIENLRRTGQHEPVFEFAHDEAVNALGATGLVHLYFDQWQDICNLRTAAVATICKTAPSKCLT